jgi:transposase
MESYVGLDLHSKNTYIAILEKGTLKRQYHTRLNNNLSGIVQALESYREDIQGIAVESTYNWYWLVDGLAANGYENRVHLANPAAMKQYDGLKYTDDKHDAFWLAHMLSLGILPTGYIYPEEARAVRDLLRKRTKLVRQHTANLLSSQSLIVRQTGYQLDANNIKKYDTQKLVEILGNKYIVMSADANLKVLQFLQRHIDDIEKTVLCVAKLDDQYKNLISIPGIGTILGTGDINRFKKVGNFSSYCRCASSKRISNNKSKGKGNTKNGNRYLAWAFIEAANFARRYNESLNKYFQRKAARTNKIVATKALANKLARAAYFIMKNQDPFDQGLLIS